MEEKKMNIKEKLALIQSELKAPKGQYNNFGKYKYRSAEDILEAVKPICLKYRTVLTLSDETILIGDRYYSRATALLEDFDSTDYKQSKANAREDENKKGMDGSQITGTSSSYARKYALNGLFDIDDTKDADTDEHANQTKEEVKYATDEQREQIQELLSVDRIDKMLNYYGIKSSKELPYDEAVKIIERETKK